MSTYDHKPSPLHPFEPCEAVCLKCEKTFTRTAKNIRRCPKCNGDKNFYRRNNEEYKAAQRERNRLWREKQKAMKLKVKSV